MLTGPGTAAARGAHRHAAGAQARRPRPEARRSRGGARLRCAGLAAVLQELRLSGRGRKHEGAGAVAGVSVGGACPTPMRLLLCPWPWAPMRGRQVEQRPAVAVARAGHRSCYWLCWLWHACWRWPMRWTVCCYTYAAS